MYFLVAAIVALMSSVVCLDTNATEVEENNETRVAIVTSKFDHERFVSIHKSSYGGEEYLNFYYCFNGYSGSEYLKAECSELGQGSYLESDILSAVRGKKMQKHLTQALGVVTSAITGGVGLVSGGLIVGSIVSTVTKSYEVSRFAGALAGVATALVVIYYTWENFSEKIATTVEYNDLFIPATTNAITESSFNVPNIQAFAKSLDEALNELNSH